MRAAVLPVGFLDNALTATRPGFGPERSDFAQEASGPEDRWLAADKARHFMLAFGAVEFAYAGLRTAGMDRRPASLVAVVAAAGAGLGKELSDQRRGRGFSLRDLAWDAAGIAAGAVLIQGAR